MKVAREAEAAQAEWRSASNHARKAQKAAAQVSRSYHKGNRVHAMPARHLPKLDPASGLHVTQGLKAI